MDKTTDKDIIMNGFRFDRWALALAAATLLVASGSRAEVFKWVDENGQTHYSENKAAAGKARAEPLKGHAQPPSAEANGAGAQYPRKVDSLMGDGRTPQRKTPASVPSRPKPLSNGRDDGTDASRCALARDVLSGAVRHTNGKPTDDYDRQVAENDVRTFCH